MTNINIFAIFIIHVINLHTFITNYNAWLNSRKTHIVNVVI